MLNPDLGIRQNDVGIHFGLELTKEPSGLKHVNIFTILLKTFLYSNYDFIPSPCTPVMFSVHKMIKHTLKILQQMLQHF